MIDIIIANLSDIGSALLQIVGGASMIALAVKKITVLTPTLKDDAIIDKIISILDFVSLNTKKK
jgi:phosphotransferase system IIB component